MQVIKALGKKLEESGRLAEVTRVEHLNTSTERHGLRARIALFLGLCLGLKTQGLQAELARQHQAFDRLVLPGGRASLLGGAYTSLSDDPAGILYNPAGTARTKQNQVSLNTWSQFKSLVNYKEAVLGKDFTETSSTRFGGFAGGIVQKKPFTLGYVIATLDKRNINQNDYFFDLSQENEVIKDFIRIHQEASSLDLFGASISARLGSSFLLGLAGLYYDRSIEAMDYQQAKFNGGQNLIQQSKIKVSNQGFHLIAGLQYQGKAFSYGLGLRAGKSLINEGRLNFNSLLFKPGGAEPETVVFETDEYDDEEEIIPLLVRNGLTWHPSPGFLLSFDLSYSEETLVNNGTPDRLGTFNYALGTEFGFAETKLLAAIFSNNSLFPAIYPEQINQSTQINYLGRSVGVSALTKSFDLYLGYVRQEGKGKSQIISGSTATQEVDALIEHLVISWNFKL